MCKETKDVSKFNSNKMKTDGLQIYCKKCTHEINKKSFSTLDGFITKIFSSTRKGAEKRNIEFNITKDEIAELYKKQNGRCAISNNELTHIAYSTEGKKYHGVINKWNISIDRIDSNKNYTIDNIQLVGAIVNIMKNDIDNNEFILLCNLIFENKN